MSKPYNPAAFPIPEQHDSKGYSVASHQPGMTLRDYFAAAALMVVTPTAIGADWMTVIARDAYVIADAMLVERLK